MSRLAFRLNNNLINLLSEEHCSDQKNEKSPKGGLQISPDTFIRPIILSVSEYLPPEFMSSAKLPAPSTVSWC